MERCERGQSGSVSQPIGMAVLRRGPTLLPVTLEQREYGPPVPSLPMGSLQQLEIPQSRPLIELSVTQQATIGRIPMHTTLMPPANEPCPRGQELPDKKKKRRRRKKKSNDQLKEAEVVEK